MKKVVAIQSDKLKDINIKTDTTLLLALKHKKEVIQLFGMKPKT